MHKALQKHQRVVRLAGLTHHIDVVQHAEDMDRRKGQLHLMEDGMDGH
jgi:hypothetical protein